jgi:ribonucleoside-diphosphate reductase alpha chain
MSNGININIVKRTGKKEPLNIDKIHKVVELACEGLAGVSSSQIEMNANIQFYDGMSTDEIQEILIKGTNDLISLDAPNYQYAAARLLSYAVYKQVFGEYNAITFQQNIDRNIERKVYDPEILEKYTTEEIITLDSYIRHKRDENFTYAGLRQVVDKYLVQDRSNGQIFETPQFM